VPSETILLVEDEPAVASMLMMVMKRWGLEVIHASTAREAVDAARNQSEISLVVCDVNLKGEPGPVVVDKIRAILPQIKTLFPSGYPLETLSETGLLTPEALQPGCTGYLQKPFWPGSLQDTVFGLLLATTASPVIASNHKRVQHAGFAS